MKPVCVLVDGTAGIEPAEALQMARVRLSGEDTVIEGTLTEPEARGFGSEGFGRLKLRPGESFMEWKDRALVNRKCAVPGYALYARAESYEVDDVTLFSESVIFAGWVKENGSVRNTVV